MKYFFIILFCYKRNPEAKAIMSYSNSSSRVPFCKHCDNLGFNNKHWLYSNGVLICEVLKNTVCQNCNKKGHTRSKCTQQYNNPVENEVRLTSENIKQKYFHIINDFPEFSCNTEIPINVNTKPTYAKIVSIAPTLPSPIVINFKKSNDMEDGEMIEEKIEKIKKPSVPFLEKMRENMTTLKSWADYTDSDSDGENY